MHWNVHGNNMAFFSPITCKLHVDFMHTQVHIHFFIHLSDYCCSKNHSQKITSNHLQTQHAHNSSQNLITDHITNKYTLDIPSRHPLTPSKTSCHHLLIWQEMFGRIMSRVYKVLHNIMR